MMAAGAILFALPSCDQLAGLIDAAQEEEENNDPEQNEPGENLPPYSNIELVETDNSITLSFQVNTDGKYYYGAKFYWNFKDDVCTTSGYEYDCESETVAKIIALSNADDPNVTVSGKTIKVNTTEEYAGESKEDIRREAEMMKLSMELANEESAKE